MKKNKNLLVQTLLPTLFIASFSQTLLTPALAFDPPPNSDLRNYPAFSGVEGDFFTLGIGDWHSLHFIGVKNEKQIINLAPAKNVLPDPSLSSTTLTPLQLQPLTLDEEGSGFQVRRTITLNLGAGPGWEIPSTFGVPSVGIMPVTGGKATALWNIPKRADLENLPSLKLPWDREVLDSWEIGNRLSYQATGGITFFGALGLASGVGVGLHYFAVGEWIVSVEKVAAREIVAKITKAKLHSFGQSYGSALAYLKTSQFSGADQSFSFHYHLDHDSAFEAYHDLLKGRLSTSETLAEDPQSGVKRFYWTQGKAQGHFRNWFIGIPVLMNAFNLKGRMFFSTEMQPSEHSLSPDSSEPLSVLYYQGALVREKAKTGVLLNDKSTRNDFFSYYQTPGHTYQGQYRWFFEEENTLGKHLSRAIHQLVKQTGLKNLVEFEVPDKKIGYSRLHLDFNLTQKATDHLMELAKSETVLENTAQRLIILYFNQGDALSLCKGLFQSLKSCKKHFTKQTQNALEKMKTALLKMNELKAVSAEKFSRQYLYFGDALQTNYFTFNTVLQNTIPTGATLEYSVEGERISRFKRRMNP